MAQAAIIMLDRLRAETAILTDGEITLNITSAILSETTHLYQKYIIL